MKLIVGLGNPGKKYENTRHNIGFLILDSLAKKVKLKFEKSVKFQIAKGDDFILLKPLTYMNLSGKAIVQMLERYPVDEILVVVDDIYLNLSNIRIRRKGGDGGHNGLKSIISELESSDFIRFRVGIGNNTEKELSDYVLSEFSKDEYKILNETIQFSTYLIMCFIESDYTNLLNSFSKMKNSYSKKIQEILESFSPKEDNNEKLRKHDCD